MSVERLIREVIRDWSGQPECDKLGGHEEEELADKLVADALPAIEKSVRQKRDDEWEEKVKGEKGERWFVSVTEDERIDRSWPASCEDGETPQERLMGAGVKIVAVIPESALRERDEELRERLLNDEVIWILAREINPECFVKPGTSASLAAASREEREDARQRARSALVSALGSIFEEPQ